MARNIRNLARGLVPLVAYLLAASAAAQQEPDMPGSLRGHWYQNGQYGKRQCERYLADPEDESAIVGQLRIREHDFDAFSEYGEGNHSRVTAVLRQGADRWQVSELTSIEGDIDHGTPGRSMFRLSDGLLHLSYGDTLRHGDAQTQQASERIYFRCK
ncbi:hypothetical protein [Pseudoxanthomonas wuyuanensis]